AHRPVGVPISALPRCKCASQIISRACIAARGSPFKPLDRKPVVAEPGASVPIKVRKNQHAESIAGLCGGGGQTHGLHKILRRAMADEIEMTEQSGRAGISVQSEAAHRCDGY